MNYVTGLQREEKQMGTMQLHRRQNGQKYKTGSWTED
jgi:hypothetical protein